MLRAFLDNQGKKVIVNPRRIECIVESGAGKAVLVFSSGHEITTQKTFDEIAIELQLINEMVSG